MAAPGAPFTIFDRKTINAESSFPVILTSIISEKRVGEAGGGLERCTKKRIAIFSRDRARIPRLQPFVSDFFFPFSPFLFFQIFFGTLLDSMRIFLSVLRRSLTRNRAAKRGGGIVFGNRLRRWNIEKAKIKFVQYALCALFCGQLRSSPAVGNSRQISVVLSDVIYALRILFVMEA